MEKGEDQHCTESGTLTTRNDENINNFRIIFLDKNRATGSMLYNI